MEIAHSVAKRSTCYRANVGAVLVDSGYNICSIGYNGPRSKEPHCSGNECLKSKTGSCLRSVHAEINALTRVTKPFEGILSLYVTHAPCLKCARFIAEATHLRRLFFGTHYKSSEGLQALVAARRKIDIIQVIPNGMLINLAGELLDGSALQDMEL